MAIGNRVSTHFSHMWIMPTHMRNRPFYMRMYANIYPHMRLFLTQICDCLEFLIFVESLRQMKDRSGHVTGFCRILSSYACKYVYMHAIVEIMHVIVVLQKVSTRRLMQYIMYI